MSHARRRALARAPGRLHHQHHLNCGAKRGLGRRNDLRRRQGLRLNDHQGHAKELIGKNIRVNAVSPGVIATPFHERYSTPETLEAMRRTIPANRLGTAEECVGAYLFLASAALSAYIVGQIIEVNGGQLMP